MDDANIILTGFMGTGKSSTGQVLAAKLGYAFVDSDALIEAREGRRVADIFAERGEAAFRALERAVAAELAAGRRQVVATGGRMMLDPENARLLGESGHVFCLTAELDTLLERLDRPGVRAKRPLLAGPGPLRDRLAALLAERAPAYARFEAVPTDGRTPEAVAEAILHAAPSWQARRRPVAPPEIQQLLQEILVAPAGGLGRRAQLFAVTQVRVGVDLEDVGAARRVEPQVDARAARQVEDAPDAPRQPGDGRGLRRRQRGRPQVDAVARLVGRDPTSPARWRCAARPRRAGRRSPAPSGGSTRGRRLPRTAT
ncbi:MAG: hypothetical protein KatS3mg121_0728 [Gammaproteobacteria bacterium]|nr:MAG: hypothetical protein KatS3mg121_0728 [Gammaproteobacteria bacterium]